MKCIPDHVLDAPPESPAALPEYFPGTLPAPVPRAAHRRGASPASSLPSSLPWSDRVDRVDTTGRATTGTLGVRTTGRTPLDFAVSGPPAVGSDHTDHTHHTHHTDRTDTAGGASSSFSAERGRESLGERVRGAVAAAVAPLQSAGVPPGGSEASCEVREGEGGSRDTGLGGVVDSAPPVWATSCVPRTGVEAGGAGRVSTWFLALDTVPRWIRGLGRGALGGLRGNEGSRRV